MDLRKKFRSCGVVTIIFGEAYYPLPDCSNYSPL